MITVSALYMFDNCVHLKEVETLYECFISNGLSVYRSRLFNLYDQIMKI